MSMKRKLRKAYASATPDVWDRVAQACGEQKLPAYEMPQSQSAVKGYLPYWLTETLGVTAAVALLICVISGGAWFMSHYGPASFGDNPTVQTGEPTETTLPNETTNHTESMTDPVETTPPTSEPIVEVSYDLPVEAWLVEDPEYLSYEEYFSKDREYSRSSGSYWMKQEDACWITFSVSWKDDGLVIGGGEPEDKYLVPDSLNYNGFEILAADGKYVYLLDTEIGRMDMVTGGYETLYMAEDILCWASYDGMVTYFIALHETDGQETIKICRMYLPTGQVDVVHEESATDIYYLHLEKVYSGLGDVRWTKLNPDYIAAMRKELADPDSDYKIGHYDNSEYWEAEDGIQMMLDNGNFMLLDEMEDGLGVRAQVMAVYNCASGKYSEKLGIFDDCWYGSGYPHDHFNPDVMTAPEPEVIMSAWTAMEVSPDFDICPAEVSEEDSGYGYERIALVTGVDSQQYLYTKTNGKYNKIVEEPVKSATNTTVCAIYVTLDDRVMAVSYDGTQSVELYQASYGEIEEIDIGESGSLLVVQDGTTLVQIDLKELCVRELVRHDDIHLSMIDYEEIDGNTVDTDVYFEVYVGLHVSGYTLNFETGELIEQYRL